VLLKFIRCTFVNCQDDIVSDKALAPSYLLVIFKEI
jgi:hypothetical protein